MSVEQSVLNFEQGQSLKQHGQDMAGWGSLNFVVTMREVAKQMSEERGQVTIDELRIYARDNGLVPNHPNAWGTLFIEKGWLRLEDTKSNIRSNRNRRVGIWQWCPTLAAIRSQP